MPIHKTEVLGSLIQINYEENEKDKLLKLITKFKERLNEFSEDRRVNNKLVMFLSGLKAEDELEETKNLFSKVKFDKNNFDKQSKLITELNNSIILLKNQIEDLKSKNLLEVQNNQLANKEIEKIENLMRLINTKIKDVIK